jgi:fatty acid desaturase
MIDTQDLKALRSELKQAGVFDRREGRTWLELLALLAAFVATTAGVALWGLPAALVLVPLGAVALTSAVMLGHEGGHKALSDSRWRNEAMLHVAFPFIGGLSAKYWVYKHNVLHHGHPNAVQTDEDLNLWPMAASRWHHQRSGAFLQWFQRHLQGWAFWPLTSFLTWSMRVSSVAHLAREARAGRVDGLWWLDAVSMVLHPVLWLVAPALLFGVWPVVAFYVVTWGLIGVFLSAIFVPAHVGLPMVDGYEDAWLLQLQTTRNLAMPRWLSFLFMGLDHQVEHHLFPRISHRRLPLAATIVRAWAERLNLPHQSIGYVAGLREVSRLMHRAYLLDVGPQPAR